MFHVHYFYEVSCVLFIIVSILRTLSWTVFYVVKHNLDFVGVFGVIRKTGVGIDCLEISLMGLLTGVIDKYRQGVDTFLSLL